MIKKKLKHKLKKLNLCGLSLALVGCSKGHAARPSKARYLALPDCRAAGEKPAQQLTFKTTFKKQYMINVMYYRTKRMVMSAISAMIYEYEYNI